MKRLTLCLMGLHLALLPCFADVIPSKYDDKDPAHRQAVKTRLVELGVNGSDAERRVQRLDCDELAYFAQSPERIQPAGALYWYEWVGGAVVIAAIVLAVIIINPKGVE